MSQILVVDDDSALHELIEAALASEGHTLRHAFSGREGLEMLAREKFDLALIDYVMPGMDGGEFLEILRHDYPGLRAMMITAFGTPEAVLNAMRKRVCDFIVKPFSMVDLKAAVHAALGETAQIEIEVI